MADQFAVTRFPSGLTNVAENDIFSFLPEPDPTKLHTFFDDFNSFVAADWIATETGGGAATQALVAGNGGLLALVNTAGNNDLNSIQKTPALIAFTAAKASYFKARVKVDDATNAAFVVGVQIVDTTPLDVTDGIYFLKPAASTTVSIVARKDASPNTLTATVGTVANDTFADLAWAYDGNGKLLFAFNGVIVGALTVTDVLPDATNCTITVAVSNGTAAARTLTADFVMFKQER